MRIKKYLGLPYIALVISSLIMMVNSFAVKGHMDIHLHDTYWVIGNRFIDGALAIFLFGFWIIYAVAGTILQTGILTRLHIYSWTAFFCVRLVYDWLGWPKHQPRNTPLKYDDIEKFNGGWVDVFYFSITILFLLGCVCFLANIIIGVFRFIMGWGRTNKR